MATTLVWLQHITWDGTAYLPGQVATVDDSDAERLVRGHYAKVGTEGLPPTTPNPLPQYVLDTELQTAVDAAVQAAQGDFVTQAELDAAVTARLEADGYVNNLQLQQAISSAPYASDQDVADAVAAAPYLEEADLAEAVPANLPARLSTEALELEGLELAGDLQAHPLGRWYAALGARQQTPARVVTLGSSTTAGAVAAHPETQWTGRLLRTLQQAYPNGVPGLEAPPMTLAEAIGGALVSTPGVQLINGGVSGTTAADYVSSQTATNVRTVAPALIIHMIGSNDSVLDVTPEQYKADLEYTLGVLDYQANTDGKPTCHLLAHTFRRWQTTVEEWAAYREVLRQIADGRDNVLLVDLARPFELMQLYGADPLDLMSTDSVHLTDAGHAVMADLMGKAMRVDRPDHDDRRVFLDTFSRPPGALGVAEYPAPGAAWTTLPAGCVTISARGVASHAAGGTALVDCGMSDVDVTGVINVGEGASLSGLIFKGQDDTNRMGVFINRATGQVALYRARTALSNVVLHSEAFPTTISTTYIVRVIAKGDRIVAWVNGKRALSFTLTADDAAYFQQYTKVGYRCAAPTTGLHYRSIVVRRL